MCAKLQDKYKINPLSTKRDTVIEEVSDDIFKGIIPQRKAFIDWINDVFLHEIQPARGTLELANKLWRKYN